MQRRPRNDADPVRLCRREDLELDRPGHEVVDALFRHETEEVPPVGRLLRRGEVPAGEVRRADVAHLALGDEQLHRLPDLLPRRVARHVVHLVEVDDIGLQPPQRRLTRGDDVAEGQPLLVGPFAHPAVHLGGEHDLVAAPAALGEPPADDLLGDTLAELPSVDVGRVEEVDAVLERAVHDGVAVGFGGLGAEVHRAEAQPADRQAGAAEIRVLHSATVSGQEQQVPAGLTQASLAAGALPKSTSSQLGPRLTGRSPVDPSEALRRGRSTARDGTAGTSCAASRSSSKIGARPARRRGTSPDAAADAAGAGTDSSDRVAVCVPSGRSSEESSASRPARIGSRPGRAGSRRSTTIGSCPLRPGARVVATS